MKFKTKDLVATSLLTTIAIIIPLVVPPQLKVSIPPFSATPTSHVPLILAMFINPYSAIFVALGSAIGFFFAMGPIIAARAAMHVLFTAMGAYMIKKRYNLYLTIFVTMIIHTLSDMFTVYVLFVVFGQTGIIGKQAMSTVQYIIGAGTSIHHLVDFAIAMIIFVPLSKQGFEVFAPVSFGFENKKIS